MAFKIVLFLRYFIFKLFYLFIPGVVFIAISGKYPRGLIAGGGLLILDLIISLIKTIRTIQLTKDVLKKTDFFTEEELDEDLGASIRKLVDIRKSEYLEEEDSFDYEELIEELPETAIVKKLKSEINSELSLLEIIDKFKIITEEFYGPEDMYLYESGKDPFYKTDNYFISLTYQYETDDLYQARLDIEIDKNLVGYHFNKSFWDHEYPDFWEAVKNDKIVKKVIDNPGAIIKVIIYESSVE